MKIYVTNLSFKGININKLRPIDMLYVADIKKFEKFTDGVDVFLKSVNREFPHKGYKHSTIPSNAIEIAARPKNLSFFEKLFGKRTQKGYYPVGNLRDFVESPKPTFEELLKDVVSKVK